MVLFDDVGHAEASVLKDTYTILPKVFSHLPWLAYEFKWHPILNP